MRATCRRPRVMATFMRRASHRKPTLRRGLERTIEMTIASFSRPWNPSTVPTWGDLKASTAARIATQGGPAVMRVAHYYRPAGGPNHRWLTLREEEYARLVAEVEKGLPPVENPEDRVSHQGFDPTARIYDSTGHYTLGNTCNQWVGDTLAAAGIEMGLWTPLAGGVMKWIPEGRARP